MPARQHRITRGDDYRRIVRTGIRVGDALCVVHAVFHAAVDDLGPARFGFIVARSVGNAVQRNLVRRRLKSIAQRHLVEGLAGIDIVIRAHPKSLHAPFSELEQSVGDAITRILRKRRQFL